MSDPTQSPIANATVTPRRLTLATALLFTVTAFIALAVFNGIVLDALGLPIHPWLVLIAAIAELVAAIACLWRKRARRLDAQYDELCGFLLLIAIVTAYLIYPSLPGRLPPARHFDAVNHVLLTSFIFEHNALPRDFSGNSHPYFMSGYPAGGALFGALVSHWTGNIPIKTIHPLISVVLGLAAGLVFLFICALLPSQPISKPIAFLATVLLFTAWDFFPGTVNERYFYAQIFSQFFALSAFLFVYHYWVNADWLSLILMPMAIGIVLVSHPTPIVAPTLATFAVIALHPRTPLKQKIVHAAVWAAGILAVVFLYVMPHFTHWIALTGYGEAVSLAPETIGLVLPVLSAIGIVIAIQPAWRKTFWFPFLLLAAILAQPAALFVGSFVIQNIGTYYFEKSVYLLIYPLAMLAALPFAEIARRVQPRTPNIAWGIALGTAIAIVLVFPPRPFAPLTEDEFQVAMWAKQSLDTNNIGVVSGIREDAYWVQLPIFDHPPSVRVTGGAYHLGSMTFEEWRGNPGEPDYAIVRNLARIPKDTTIQVVYRYGESGILLKPRAEIPQPPSPQHKTQIRFGDILNLVGYDVAYRAISDSPLEITFYWQPTQWPTNHIGMLVQILDQSGKVVARAENELPQKKFPTQRWPIGVITADPWKSNSELSPGDYTIQVALFSRLTGERLEVRQPGAEPTDEANLGTFRVTLPALSDDELRAARNIQARFGEGIALRAFAISPLTVRRGDSLTVTLYWQSLARVNVDYTVFVHLLDANGQLRAQRDSPPQNGTQPTSAWTPNDIIQDPYRLAVPQDAMPGTYRIAVGLYTPSDMKRVPVTTNSTALDDHVALPVTITVQ